MLIFFLFFSFVLYIYIQYIIYRKLKPLTNNRHKKAIPALYPPLDITRYIRQQNETDDDSNEFGLEIACRIEGNVDPTTNKCIKLSDTPWYGVLVVEKLKKITEDDIIIYVLSRPK